MNDLATPLASPSKQRRSEVTAQAIVAAGLALMHERDFDTIAVADVTRRAKVSIGGFYARFRGKDALLHALAQSVTDDCAAALERALGRAGTGPATLEQLVRGYVKVMIAKFRAHRRAIVQIMRYARSGDPHLAELLQRFNQRVHGRFRELAGHHLAEVRHPDPRSAINVGLFAVSAAAREAVLGNGLQVYPVSLPDARLVEELVRLYLGYLAPRAVAGRLAAHRSDARRPAVRKAAGGRAS